VTTLEDFARLCRMTLDGGTLGKARILGPASIRAMTRNQLDGFPQLAEEDRRCRPWGLGWRLHWPGSSANFGDLIGPNAYGHWGATGTLCWIDPDADAFFLLFTTQPGDDDGRHLARLSNMIAAALR
jgi:CubicO group peptidase (beta-lactamase class C family)